jgi:hypothetical protein
LLDLTERFFVALALNKMGLCKSIFGFCSWQQSLQAPKRRAKTWIFKSIFGFTFCCNFSLTTCGPIANQHLDEKKKTEQI